jgi:hypothetical protein
VDGLQEMLPGALDVGGVAVICKVEDLQANVVVTTRVGIFIEELRTISTDAITNG